ncbi:hypothetical protein LTR10_013178 [Elasticomyces elasticus]|uniref:Retrotransposon Copia-like N-terminal domain-containing protein n=1 Tax=Exophiala sideris TaxID=1016849 RepID=A0ABR0JB22_9EURO|nr:hypothetical protein LTR10_013178 [Elasticomyces elasticus]KAK5030553.1 hypothetical protein LTS07_005337 [Exophiala sideris]KAK5038607.1 hypothetical protein LTR13_004354 [Exophiala sideris]KAK5060488.1 hypothetical protein LTR69_005805 [Exophiala sideris]KAK5183400.1 hypothetical protein LTR44_004401 [Eurotiomycetes sp. CCFEE 6388]
MEVVDVYPTNSISIYAYSESLSFPPMFSVTHLLGKSNFKAWRACIEPILLKNPYSSKLILGEWNEPTVQASAGQTNAELDQARKAWQSANTATCRVIRATLALNVVPFIRQHSTAKALYLNLIWLYGEDAGIDIQGGPPAPSSAQTANPNRNRASLLAALESDKPLGDVIGIGNLFPPPSAYASSNSSTTSLLPKSSTSSSAAAETKRPDSQALPTKYLQEIAVQPLPPPPRIHIYERTRISPDPSLETIHEEPHPGQRVSFGRAASAGSNNLSISPITSSEASGDDDIDLSPSEDVGGESYSAKNNKHGEWGPSVVVKDLSNSLYGSGKQKQSRTRKRFSFSFPLRRLNKNQSGIKHRG